LLFVFSSVWASLISFGLVGLYPGIYNSDPHLAINFARYYLHRPDQLAPLVDIYTHGFLHPLVYLPVVYLLQLLRVPFSMQDGIAIGLIYGLSMGAISILTYYVSRYYNNKYTSSLISLLVTASILVHPGEIDFYSPNAELLGSVLLLFYWGILLYRGHALRSTVAAIIIGVLVFHLKYQLLPQLFCFTFIAGIRFRRATLLALLIVALSLLVDLLAYRFSGGFGFFGRVFMLTNDYVRTPNPEFSRSIKTLLLFAPNILKLYPLFLVSWSIWLYRVAQSFKRFSPSNIFALPGFSQALILSVITIASIVIPAKNFPHYYILLLPTSVFILNKALAHEPTQSVNALLSTRSYRLAERINPRVIGASLLPFAIVSMVLSAVSYFTKGSSNGEAPLLMTKAERLQGAHLYGWSSGAVYGSYGTYPVNPALDLALMSIKFSLNKTPYNRIMMNSQGRPEYLIDLSVVDRNAILGNLIKPIEKLKGLPGYEWANSYHLVRKNTSGWLYKLSSQ
jgi:hypothetical protein